MFNKNTKITLWGFLNTDYKAMIEKLENMARKGWMLEKFVGFTAIFTAIPPQNIKFYVDILPGSGVFDSATNPELLEHRKVYEEAGWSFLTSKGYLQFFCAEPDTHPTPIQKDTEIEEKLIKSTILRNEYIGILMFFMIAIYNIFKFRNFDYHQLLSFTGVFAKYFFSIAIIPLLIWITYIIFWNIKLRKYLKMGVPMPAPSLKAAKIRATALSLFYVVVIASLLLAFLGDALTGHGFILIALIPPLVGISISLALKKYFKASQDDKKTKVSTFIIALVATVIITPFLTMVMLSGVLGSDEKIENVPKGYPVLKLEDFPGYEQANLKWQRFDKRVSPVVPKSFEYREFDENRILISSEYYRAINSYFAKRIFDGKLKEETRYGDAILGSKAEWNADQVYYIRDTNRVLVLKDNMVIFVEGDFDLSKAEIRGIVISKLLQKS